jgi:hypothetical protein
MLLLARRSMRTGNRSSTEIRFRSLHLPPRAWGHSATPISGVDDRLHRLTLQISSAAPTMRRNLRTRLRQPRARCALAPGPGRARLDTASPPAELVRRRGHLADLQCNQLMFRWGATVALVVATALVDVVALQLSADAMECCAKTEYECAGIQTPDDCCQTMGHSLHDAAATTPQSQLNIPAPLLAVAAAVAVALPEGSVRTAPLDIFKRPHDPPHLHPVPLLI